MIENIKKFFSDKMYIEPTLDQPQPEQIAIATCALLLEMAHADSEFAEEERINIIAILKKYYNLDEKDTAELLKNAELERKESLDLWQFTNLINQNYSRDEKLHIVETLWSVIYTDGRVDKHEEYLVRRLTNLLNLDHQEMIDAKFKARENLKDK